MNRTLLDLLQSPTRDRTNRIYGVVTGVVTNIQDEEGLGRVRVRFPWLSEEDESWWARIATPMAGGTRGVYFLPEVDDEVLVAFEHGDVRFPYIVGALWNSRQKPPETNDDGKNNRRTIKSRSGHTIRLDDAEGEESIEIVDKTGSNSILITAADNTITIRAGGDVTIDAPNGKLTLNGDSIAISAKASVAIESQQSMQVTAAGQLSLKGATVNIN